MITLEYIEFSFGWHIVYLQLKLLRLLFAHILSLFVSFPSIKDIFVGLTQIKVYYRVCSLH